MRVYTCIGVFIYLTDVLHHFQEYVYFSYATTPSITVGKKDQHGHPKRIQNQQLSPGCVVHLPGRYIYNLLPAHCKQLVSVLLSHLITDSLGEVGQAFRPRRNRFVYLCERKVEMETFRTFLKEHFNTIQLSI